MVVEGPQRLGDDLVAQGLLTSTQLAWALEAHERTGERLGRILLAAGLVDRRALYRTLARAWSLPFYDLRESPAEAAVAERFPRELLVREGWIPLAVHGQTLIVATCEEPTVAQTEDILERSRTAGLGVTAVRFVGTTEWDIRYEVRRVFRAQIQKAASYELLERDASLSAVTSLVPWQRIALLLSLGAMAILAATVPRYLLAGIVIVLSIGFLISVAFKLVVCVVGWRLPRRSVSHRRGRRAHRRQRAAVVHDPRPGLPRGEHRRRPDRATCGRSTTRPRSSRSSC